MFGIHTFYATATLLNMHAMKINDAADGGCGGGRIGLYNHGITTVGGVTAGQARHNSSTVGVSTWAR